MTLNSPQADADLMPQLAERLRQGDLAGAAKIADVVINHGIRHPMAYTARGLRFSQLDRHEDALQEFRYAEAISQPVAALKSSIGVSLAKLGRISEAVAAFDEAIALQPTAAQFHYRKGWALELGGELEAARLAHIRAIELQPGYFDALARLAYLAARRGEASAAKRLAQQALSGDPDHVTARLALATAEFDDGALEEAGAGLERLLANDQVQGQDRYIALGLMGDVRDAQNRVDEAFALYQAANRLNVPQAGTVRQRSMSDMVAGLISFMERRPAIAVSQPDTGADDSPQHVFVLGFPRSGTTLLEQVLASHPDVVSLEEKDTLIDSLRAFFAKPDDLLRLWALDEHALSRYRRAYWNRVKQSGVDVSGRVFVDKTPINTVYLPLIARLFPRAKIVFAVRDPRDVVLSCFRRRFFANALTAEFHSIESTAHFYDRVMTLAELYRAKLSIDVYALHHEALVKDFDEQAQALCKWIGLPWNSAMREFAERSKSRGVATPSAPQLARGLTDAGIGQWRRYAAQMGPVLPILMPWAAKFGYPDA